MIQFPDRRDFLSAAVTGSVAVSVAGLSSLLLPDRSLAQQTSPTLNPGQKKWLNEFIERFERATIKLFLDCTTESGFIRDKALVDSSGRVIAPDPETLNYASSASAGYALSAFVIGVEKGYLEKSRAQKLCDQILDQALNLISQPEYKGWLPHFLDIRTGKIWPSTEVSTVDTCLFALGAIAAGEYFGGKLKEKAELFFAKINFANQLVRTKGINGDYTFSHGFSVDGKSSQKRFPTWDKYSEGIIVAFLALGSKQNLPQEIWTQGWERGPEFKSPDQGNCCDKPLFVYYYPHGYINFQSIRPGAVGNNFWNLTKSAINLQIKACAAAGYPNGVFGLSACMQPDDKGYHAYSLASHRECVIAPPAVLAATPFNEVAAYKALKILTESGMKPNVYGLPGSVKFEGMRIVLQSGTVLTLDQGSTLVMLSNLIQKLMQRSPIIQRAYRKTGIDVNL